MDVYFWLFDRDRLPFPRKALYNKREDLADSEPHIRKSDIHFTAAPLVDKPHFEQVAGTYTDRLDFDVVTDFEFVEPAVRLLHEFGTAEEQVWQQIAAVA